MRVLVTGRNGQLATALAEVGPSRGIEIVLAGRPELDLAQPSTVAATIEAGRPDVVINAAAYTAVDQAESDHAGAEAINAAGAEAVASTCARLGIPVIQVSTDYVYAGTGPRPYREDDPAGPVSVYGRSKLAGEQLVLRANPRHIVLRTAWVYSPWGHNFVKTMLRLATTRTSLNVVDDQRGCPTYAPHLAAACLAIAERVQMEPETSRLWGLYHAAGSSDTTWCGFAREIFRLAAEHGGNHVEVSAIATRDYPTPARRPANSRLDCSKLFDTFGLRLPDWREGVAECVGRLLKGQHARS